MVAIYSKDVEIADMPLTSKQQAVLAAGEAVTVLYHTPQMLRGLLGARNGSFTLRMVSERVMADKPDAVKDYAEMQKAIKAARGHT